jgi:hypothetical protein
MRAAVILVLLLAGAALVGCLGDDAAPTDAPEAAPEDPPEPEAPQPPETSQGVQAPELAEGTAFTFDAAGAFNRLGSVTVVVASNTSEGYLFTGATPEDLVEEVVFSRAWLGELDASLNRLGDDGEPVWRFFDWPLEDGATWTVVEDPDVEVTAERTDVPTPSGPAAGFRIHGEGGDSALEYTYAPEVGYLTSLTWTILDTTLFDLTLTGVGTSETALWYEAGPRASTCGDPTSSTPVTPTATTLEVPGDADAVVAASGSVGEGETVAQPPPSANGSQPHVVQHGPEEQWFYDELPGRSGTWELTARGQPGPVAPGTYVCATLQAVTWVDAYG